MHLHIKKVTSVGFFAMILMLSGCVATGGHEVMKSKGYNNEVSVNPAISDKEFVERVQLYLVRQKGFKNAMIKMKSESLKTVIFNHDVSYSGWSALTRLAGCEYCYANVQTEIVRTSKNKAAIKHSRFTPYPGPSGIRPMLRKTLTDEIKRVLNGMDATVESTLSQ